LRKYYGKCGVRTEAEARKTYTATGDTEDDASGGSGEVP
jgi:hypothetical protein